VTAFAKWLDTFLEEKGVDLEQVLVVDAPDGTENRIPVGCLVDAMKGARASERRDIKTLLVKVDFVNGDVIHCLTHLAKAIAIPLGVERAP
jgi:hypothetical protein